MVSRELASDMKCRFEISKKFPHLFHLLNPFLLSCASSGYQQEGQRLSGMLDIGAGEGIISFIRLVSLLKSSEGTIILFLVTLSMPLASRNVFSFSLPGSVIVRILFTGLFIHWNWFYKQAPCQLFFSCFLGKGSDIFIVLVFVTMAKISYIIFSDVYVVTLLFSTGSMSNCLPMLLSLLTFS